MEEDQAQNESTPLLENEGQNSSSDQPSRSARVRKWALGSFMALLASFTYTWYNYFIKTFQQQASDVLLVKATSSLVIFGSLVLFQKQDVWPRIERCESVRQYWLQGFLLIFQVGYPQCGNIMIFLSLRFYENSVMGILEVENLPF